ncbi:MAG: DUF4115 domain-containing protein [Anaerolineae bacterium]|jgi:hypothetical protein|nr:DUF4115 domain-containing protein [Anaerolineae bacterium]
MDSYSLGQHLREAREKKELTITNAESTLKIRRHILEAFEQGNFQISDASPVQIRGFIRNYARYLGLEEDRILQYYDLSQSGGNRTRRSVQPAKRERPPTPEVENYGKLSEQRRRAPRNTRLLRLLLILLLTAIAFMVIVFVTQELINNPNALRFEPENTRSGFLIELPDTLTPTPRPTLTPAGTITISTDLVQNYTGQPVFVTMRVNQRSWIRFTADEVEIFSGLVRPDEQFVLEYQANNQIVVETSNAAALEIIYNGQPQGAYGGRGQQVEIIFQPNNDVTINSLVLLQPTMTLSGLDTPTVEITPEITTESTLTQPPPSPLPRVNDVVVTVAITPTLTATETIMVIVDTPMLSSTLQASSTAVFTLIPTDTLVPSLTPSATISPSPNAVLPPRITATGNAPEK